MTDRNAAKTNINQESLQRAYPYSSPVYAVEDTSSTTRPSNQHHEDLSGRGRLFVYDGYLSSLDVSDPPAASYDAALLDSAGVHNCSRLSPLASPAQPSYAGRGQQVAAPSWAVYSPPYTQLGPVHQSGGSSYDNAARNQSSRQGVQSLHSQPPYGDSRGQHQRHHSDGLWDGSHPGHRSHVLDHAVAPRDGPVIPSSGAPGQTQPSVAHPVASLDMRRSRSDDHCFPPAHPYGALHDSREYQTSYGSRAQHDSPSPDKSPYSVTYSTPSSFGDPPSPSVAPAESSSRAHPSGPHLSPQVAGRSRGSAVDPVNYLSGQSYNENSEGLYFTSIHEGAAALTIHDDGGVSPDAVPSPDTGPSVMRYQVGTAAVKQANKKRKPGKKSSEATFQCPFCPDKLATKFSLDRHKEYHFNRRHECGHPGCSATFGTKADCRRHVKKFHGGEGSTPPPL